MESKKLISSSSSSSLSSLFLFFFLVFFFCLIPSIHAEKENGKDLYYLIGANVTLPCPGAENMRNLELKWFREENSENIFTLKEGREKKISNYADQYFVDPHTYSLTILNMVEDSVGNYCYEISSPFLKKDCKLVNFYHLPTCDLPYKPINEGEKVPISANIRFSTKTAPGNFYVGDKKINTEHDISEIETGVFSANYEANAKDNGKSLEFRYKASARVEKCSTKLNIHYSARNIKFIPEEGAVFDKGTIKCRVEGNPPAQVTMEILSEENKGKGIKKSTKKTLKGEGEVSLVVDQNMGSSLKINCQGNNEISSQPVSKDTSFTITKAAASKSRSASFHQFSMLAMMVLMTTIIFQFFVPFIN